MSKITKAVVWSNVGCSYCEQAKNLLKSKNIEYEERKLELLSEQPSEIFEQGETDWEQSAVVDEDDLFDDDDDVK